MQYYLSNIPSYHTHTTPYINPSVPITFPNLWYFFSFSSPFYLFHIHLHLMFLSMIPNIFIIFLLWSGFWLRPGRGGRYGWCTLWRLHCKVQYGEMESERESRRETDRKCARRKIQTDTLIDWQIDRQTDRHRLTDRQTDTLIDREIFHLCSMMPIIVCSRSHSWVISSLLLVLTKDSLSVWSVNNLLRFNVYVHSLLLVLTIVSLSIWSVNNLLRFNVYVHSSFASVSLITQYRNFYSCLFLSVILMCLPFRVNFVRCQSIVAREGGLHIASVAPATR